MPRALIVLLLLANLAFFAWTQGWLDGVVGVRSTGDREPERLLRQVRPELIRILPPGASAASASATGLVTTSAAAAACLEAGPFGDAELPAAQAVMQAALPAGSWVTLSTESPRAWLVYMGRYADHEALARKEEELKRRSVPYDELREPPALAPGLALGRFDALPGATRALERLVQQGVRSARIVELAPAPSRHLLRVEQADAALAARLIALRPEALGNGFAACARPPGV